MRQRVGEALKDFREAQSKSQAKLAEEWGVSQAGISQVETGQQLGLWMLLQLREKLGRSLEDLLGLPPISPAPEKPLSAAVRVELHDAVREELHRMFTAQPGGRVRVPVPAKGIRELPVEEPTAQEVATAAAEFAQHQPGRAGLMSRHPTAKEFAAGDLRGNWSRTELALVVADVGKDERKSRADWTPIFRAKRKEVRTTETFRRGHVEKRKRAELADKERTELAKKLEDAKTKPDGPKKKDAG